MNKKTISDKYSTTPDDFSKIPEAQIHLFRKLINRQFGDMSKITYIDFVDEDPYEYTTIDQMFNDYKKGFIKVNTSGNDSKLWGKVYNLMFRAIHDIFHCKLAADFTFDDEVKAWQFQVQKTRSEYYLEKDFTKLDWDLFSSTLRSEICWQAAVKTVTGEFHIDQKIILEDISK